MKGGSDSIIGRFYRWRLRNISEKNFLIVLAIVVGITSGIAAIIIKNMSWLIQSLVNGLMSSRVHNYIYFVLPAIGIAITVFLIKFVIKKPVSHGIPNVLYSISRKHGKMPKYGMYASIVTSAITAGFGGSVGLEGPTVSAGATFGSFISRMMGMNYHNVTLLMACACAGTMAAIFKAPVAAIVFAIEVFMIDLTSFSLIPLLMSSVIAVLTSWFFLGDDVLYPVKLIETFELVDLPYYVLLGILCGLVSAYFAGVYHVIARRFDRIRGAGMKLIVGAVLLGTLIFFFPALYGEGYETINSCLQGDLSYLFDQSIFFSLQDSLMMPLILLLVVVMMKVVATSLTFGAGGIGGIFAPTLFMGANLGMLFARFTNQFGLGSVNENNFALIGMAGLIAGVLHAPLTAIFLIADISGGYEMFVPLMITAAFSFMTVRYFVSNSVYHYQLARKKELITHHKDQAVLRMMKVTSLIETDFERVKPEGSMKDVIDAVSVSNRNLFPVVDEKGIFMGTIILDNIRGIMFKQELYDQLKVTDLMTKPDVVISPDDSMEEVADKFEASGKFNMVVVDHGKYLGYISRAKVFSTYREHVKSTSHE